MRLDKLTIGSPKKSRTHQFKNLKNVTIDFEQDHWVTVVIGWNGTGKSNVLESGGSQPFLADSPLRTVRAPFSAYGSSLR